MNPKFEEEVLRKYRKSRTRTVIAIRFLVILIVVPLLVQQVSKRFLVAPILENIRGGELVQVFLNNEMKEEAFEELKLYKETLEFETLISPKAPRSGEERREAPAEGEGNLREAPAEGEGNLREAPAEGEGNPSSLEESTPSQENPRQIPTERRGEPSPLRERTPSQETPRQTPTEGRNNPSRREAVPSGSPSEMSFGSHSTKHFISQAPTETEKESRSSESEAACVPPLSEEEIEQCAKEKALELAAEFRQRSENAMSNVFADVIATGAFVVVLLVNREAIAVLKTFTNGVVNELSDSAKAFIIILSTDIFVGFHSPHGWEVILEAMASHLGIEPNRTGIFLFIATVPVIMDTILKYWLFRYLSRMAPSTLATYKEMDD